MASIFIVEDEFSLLRLYELILTAYGHTVVAVAKNGEEAVKNTNLFPPRLT